MKITVVNEKDEVIGYKERDDKNQNDINRVARLWIFNSKGEVLMAQRSFNKVNGPGKWGPAADGTVEEGETYVANIIREAKEELGITLQEEQLIVGSHEFRETSHKYFRQSFSTKLDLPIEDFKIQKEEVESIRWIDMEDLSAWLKERPQDFISSFPNSFEDLKALMNK